MGHGTADVGGQRIFSRGRSACAVGWQVNRHVMLDLETMSSANNAALVSLGAFKFADGDRQEADQVSTDQIFHRSIDLKSSEAHGLHVDPETVAWWAQQSEEARAAIAGGIDLATALQDFSDWLPKGALVWGYGATFDNVVIRSAFKAAGLKSPIHYRQDLCFRTLKAMFPDVAEVAYGIKHNALDDAIRQGLHLQRILERIRLI